MTTFYIDVSHHDWRRRGGNLDWPAVAAAGIRVVCIRASYGDPHVYAPATEHFADMATGARAAGLVVGGYHNLIRGDMASMRRQAEYLAGEVRNVRAHWAMLDVEPYEALRANGLWPRWEDVERFRAAWREDPARPALAYYVARWVWDGWLGRPDMSTLDGPLISARYVLGGERGGLSTLYERSGGGEGEGWGSYGGVYPAVWQFTSNAVVPGCTPPTDGDAFKGSADELIALLTGHRGMRSANMQVLTNQLKARHPGVVIYGIGDAAHKRSPSGHNEDDTPGSLPEDQDADSRPEHRAIDVMRGAAFSHADAVALVRALTTVPQNQRRLLYVIYNRKIYRRNGDWREENYSGSDPHTNHVHVSGEADDDENTAKWILDEAQEGNEMLMFARCPSKFGDAVFKGNGVDAVNVAFMTHVDPVIAKGAGVWMGDFDTEADLWGTIGALRGASAVQLSDEQVAAVGDKVADRLAAVIEDLGGGSPVDPAVVGNAVRAAVEAALGSGLVAALSHVRFKVEPEPVS